MHNVATLLTNMFLADIALQAVVQGQHYWELAPEEIKYPYVLFSLKEDKEATKDRRGDYQVTITCYASTLTASSELDVLVKDALLNNTIASVFNTGAQSGYTDDEKRIAVIVRTYNLKNRI